MKTITHLKRIFGQVYDATEDYNSDSDNEVEVYWCNIEEFTEEPDIAICFMQSGEIEVRCFFGKWKKVFYSRCDALNFLKSEYGE